jgi:DEAD/DEAH box helicase domain-containing protein
MRKITFDVETRNLFADVNSNESSALDISVVCIHDSETGEYSSFLQEDFPKLWPYFETADMIITFNGDHFDIPLLNKYYPGDLTKIKSLDLLVEVRNSIGRRIKLDTIAEATLGVKKTGHGLEAVEWWKSGEIDKIIKYCIEDVKITKTLYDYALKNGKLKYKDIGPMGSIKEIKLDTSKWEEKKESAMTFTLPF